MTKALKGKRAAPSSRALQVTAEANETEAQTMARLALSPSFQACAIAGKYLKQVAGELDVTAIYQGIGKQAAVVAAGDLLPAEAMLFNQAQSLQAIFTSLADRAALNAGQYLGATETYLRLALKAQAQCRATLETLAAIKYPQPTAFVRQQNIAVNQQVNNGSAAQQGPAAASARVRTEDSANLANELKVVTDEQGQRLDDGAAASAGGSDPAMATLDPRHRA